MSVDNFPKYMLIGSIAYLIGVIFGAVTGITFQENRLHKKLNKAGIQKIVECNNSQSNWVEIVWIKKGEK